jgi:hypothetical protein
MTRILLAVLATMLLSGCWDREKSIRYRVTYTFETPAGERSGSHVIESYYGPCGGAAMGPGCAQGVRGEAAVIDLGEGKIVFVILAMGPTGGNVDGPAWLPDVMYGDEIAARCKKPEGRNSCKIFDVATDGFPPHEVSLGLVFTMVTFKDIDEPASAIAIDTLGRGLMYPRDVPATFGDGFAFKNAVIEIANDSEITRGIEEKFPAVFVKLRPLDKEMQLIHFGDPIKIRTGHLSKN